LELDTGVGHLLLIGQHLGFELGLGGLGVRVVVAHPGRTVRVAGFQVRGQLGVEAAGLESGRVQQLLEVGGNVGV
jgi:hypothetical protein